MIDAGSTGSRLHVYRFRQCAADDPVQLKDEALFVQTIPGLSAYTPDLAGQSLDPLLQQALQAIPKNLRRKTPMAVRATAGLRLLGHEQSEKVLDAVYDHIHARYPFPIIGGRESGVTIMDGKDEGVYVWITVNFLLGHLKSKGAPTAAVFDLGGASTQIVFEPDRIDPKAMVEGDHQYTLTYDNHDYVLYQHSYLGYGLMEARKRMHQRILELADQVKPDLHVSHPCLPRNLEFSFPKNAPSPEATFIGQGLHDACTNIVKDILNKNAVCLAPPCSFDGIHQPLIAEAFAQGPIYIFSYFYDRTVPLGLPASFKLPELGRLTERVCMGEYFEQLPDGDLRDEMLDRPEWCLDLSFIYGLLSHGYEIPDDREIRMAKKIDGVETGWCLGAAIALLDEAGLEQDA
ncbi:nucleoside phosphatase GDA1/CD39 [Zychaea mexicana]|uniref:nucleoside phosphatase GDA1/CD39 n=1 Tax=Zychaea mexicana TaxID=64656 RepID=UPI0022FE916A|nr:nucleoside phosphatase GDA1/CD39 [Zychaea mexicana]KAI9489909.1 nucleoside phosphatase GDA1/CD39 [Zychaea mexicana]